MLRSSLPGGGFFDAKMARIIVTKAKIQSYFC
jgi:hypothetical protein